MNDAHTTPPPFGDGPPSAPPGQWSAPAPPPQGPPAQGPPAPQAPAPMPGTPAPGPPPSGQWGTPPAPGPAAPGQWGAPAPGQGQYGQQQYGQIPAQPYVPGGWVGWNAQAGARIAEPGIRIGAKVIDVVIIVIIQMVLGAVTGLLFLSTSSDDMYASSTLFATNIAFTLVSAAVGLFVDFIYNVVLVSRFGGQPGKLMLGLRVVRTDGAAPDTGVAFRRWSPMLALLVVSAIPVVGSVIGGLLRLALMVANLVMIFADDRRRDVFDHVGGTYVVATR